jgi:septal ring factor EnvC (AmiA/AmiB activator)
MLQQHAHLKKLLIILGAIMVGAVVFAAFSLYRTKTEDRAAGQPDMVRKELTGEEVIRKQLESLRQDGQPPASVEEISKQLEMLAKSDQGPTPTIEEIRTELDKLNNQEN